MLSRLATAIVGTIAGTIVGKGWWLFCILVSGALWLSAWSGSAWAMEADAASLAQRLASFEQITQPPQVEVAQGDLVYPEWFAGSWMLSTTLVDLKAPLAPDIITPGFEDNRKQLNQPILAPVRFLTQGSIQRNRSPLPLLSVPLSGLTQPKIVSDRAFNGLSLAKAYLGDFVTQVEVDPRDPNRQITRFRDGRKLYSSVEGRRVERPDELRFLTTEVFKQFFQTSDTPYQNRVEITTAYAYQGNGSISADQMTAVYLGANHPKAYLAAQQPVALYRYQLELIRP